MKIAVLATAAVLAASSASAFELGATGVSVGGEFDGHYTTGVDTFGLDFTPRAQFSNWGVTFGVETTVDVLEINNGDIFTGLDLDASYQLTPALEAYGEIGTDADLEFGDLTMGVRFGF
jgi:hypothetical protein